MRIVHDTSMRVALCACFWSHTTLMPMELFWISTGIWKYGIWSYLFYVGNKVAALMQVYGVERLETSFMPVGQDMAQVSLFMLKQLTLPLLTAQKLLHLALHALEQWCKEHILKLPSWQEKNQCQSTKMIFSPCN